MDIQEFEQEVALLFAHTDPAPTAHWFKLEYISHYKRKLIFITPLVADAGFAPKDRLIHLCTEANWHDCYLIALPKIKLFLSRETKTISCSAHVATALAEINLKIEKLANTLETSHG